MPQGFSAASFMPSYLINSKASAYNTGDLGSIPGMGRSSGKEMANHSRTLAWKTPWTEEPGRLQTMRSQSRTRLSNFTFTFILSPVSLIGAFLMAQWGKNPLATQETQV